MRTLFSIRNPNLYLNGSWTKQYWPVRSRYQKEYLNLRAGNLSVGKGYNARKCAFWDSYLPSILGKRGNYERQTLTGPMIAAAFIPLTCRGGTEV